MSRNNSRPNRCEPSQTILEALSRLAQVPEAQRRNVENWVVVTVRRYHVVVDLYCSGAVTKKSKIEGVEAAMKHLDGLLRAPDWLLPEMHSFELMALSDKPMRGLRTERAFRAADARIKREEVALSRMAKRLRLMRAAIEARPLSEFETLAEKTAAKPHNAWLARVIVSFWMKLHPEDGLRDTMLGGLHAFAHRLWMVADDLKELPVATVRTRLQIAISEVKHSSGPKVRSEGSRLDTRGLSEGNHPPTLRTWRDKYVERAMQLTVDEDSAVEMLSRRQFKLTDDPVAAADDDVAELNYGIK